MGKLLRVRDYVLLTAAGIGDIVNILPIKSYSSVSKSLSMYGFFPPERSSKSYLSEISRLLSTGNISKKIDKKGGVYLVLTNKGKREFKRRFSLLLMSKKRWDGDFMIVTFDITEKERKMRNGLRKKLKELGFGMYQKSVWISPYHFEEDMREFLESESLNEEVTVFTARKLFGEDIKELAERVWKLKKINKRYARVIQLVSRISKTSERKKMYLVKKARNIYMRTLVSDPLLPKELLPKNWHRLKVVTMLNNARI